MESHIRHERHSHARLAFVLLGIGAGAVARLLKACQGAQILALRGSVANLESRLQESVARLEQRMAAAESHINEHESRLQEKPSMAEIVAAVEGLLARSMTNLENRFAAQTDSMELLKATVSQTDNLLERVLESLDAFRQRPDRAIKLRRQT